MHTSNDTSFATADDLPNELLLLIFPHLCLQSLIRSRGVNRRWRSLVFQSSVDPVRLKLLKLYYHIITKPSFILSRAHIVPHIKHFNREEYLESLPLHSNVSVIPEEFALWILEWPEKAVIGWMWPGLDDHMSGGEITFWRDRCRCNCLAHDPVYVKTVTYCQRKTLSNHTTTTTTSHGDPHPHHPHDDDLNISFEGETGGAATTGDNWGWEDNGGMYHAATFLPVGIQIEDLQDNISWLNDDESHNEVVVSNLDITALCISQYARGGGSWLILDGGRGGEKMKGFVYRGGYGLRSEDVLAESWIEYLESEVRKSENALLKMHMDG
ncbi:hypothetical protein ABKN59_001821 [Abortiporus biennis]